MAASDAPAIELRPVNVSKFEERISRKWLQAALAGDFASAWSASDEIQRARLCFSGRERWHRSLWNGSPIVDRNVLVRCWRGLGDAIHFSRYARPCPGKGQEPHSRGSWDAGALLRGGCFKLLIKEMEDIGKVMKRSY